MTLLEKILEMLKQEFKLNSIDPNCFSSEDLELIKSEDYSKIPAIHACIDDDNLWVSQDMDETDDSYECYDLITMPEEYNYTNIYLYNLIED